jgi:protein TonB
MTLLQDNIGAYRSAQTLPQRITGLIFVAALHVILITALLNALGVPMPYVPMSFNGYVILPDIDTPPLPPPPIPLIPTPRLVDIPPPPIVEIPLENPGTTAITPPQPQPAALPEHQASLEPPVPPPVLFTPARAIAATHTIPDYPPVSRRLGEQGTLHLRLAITADGAVSDAQIESSSGHTRLDEAAMQWVKAHWRYEPALEGTKRVPATAKAVVTFKLN